MPHMLNPTSIPVLHDHGCLPDALEEFEQLSAGITSRRVAVFLDYDGTLTSITLNPAQAVLSDAVRTLLAELARRVCLVAVISGRDKMSLKQLIQLPQLCYAGSHGFDIEGPENTPWHHELGQEYRPLLTHIAATLQQQLHTIPGVIVEHKKYAIAVHYRAVAERWVDSVRTITQHAAAQHAEVNIRTGKKILEIQPAIDWDKGKSMLWIAARCGFNPDDTLFYLGDDQTDEDAFRVMPAHGVSILIGTHGEKSYARYHLQDVASVQHFLQRLRDVLG